MKLCYSAAALTVLMGCSSTLLAADADDKGPWSGEASLGYTKNSGNTNSTSISSKAEATHDRGGKWRQVYKFEGANEETEEERTKEKYYVSAKDEYKFEEKSYFFGLVEYVDDRFSGFNYEAALSFGYGHEFIKNEIQELSMDFGVGYRWSEEEISDDVIEEAFVSYALDYMWNINENTVFDEEFSVEVGEEKTITKSYTRLKMRINGSLFGFVSYEIKHTSDVPVNTKNSDRTTVIGVDYQF